MICFCQRLYFTWYISSLTDHCTDCCCSHILHSLMLLHKWSSWRINDVIWGWSTIVAKNHGQRYLWLSFPRCEAPIQTAAVETLCLASWWVCIWACTSRPAEKSQTNVMYYSKCNVISNTFNTTSPCQSVYTVHSLRLRWDIFVFYLPDFQWPMDVFVGDMI